MNKIKISIITVVYNGEKYIEDTIVSVLRQTYNNIEYIIIDGQSTDNTINIINKYKDSISTIISEKDNGLYDAMNKGIKISSGDIIGILNADDFFIDVSLIEKIATIFSTNNNIDILYSDLVFVDRDNKNKIVRTWKSGVKQQFKSGWHPPHPTMFIKKDMYEKFGYFNLNFKISADYELMLRFIEKNNARLFYLPQTTIKMRAGGYSNKNIKNIIIANLEVLKAWKTNGFKTPFSVFLLKPLKKIKQLFRLK